MSQPSTPLFVVPCSEVSPLGHHQIQAAVVADIKDLFAGVAFRFYPAARFAGAFVLLYGVVPPQRGGTEGRTQVFAVGLSDAD
ncbi:MAG: hypothetical protein AB9Q18_12075 [Candidatus Reddybacter sp.]